MQNHLDEFYAMVDFCNPGVLGSPAEFRKRYEAPILAGERPGCLDVLQHDLAHAAGLRSFVK